MRTGYLLLSIILFAGCKPDRKVNTSFYYWKTVYRQNTTENAYLQHLHTHQLYVRIMDVDMGENGADPVPVSPIIFQDKLADSLQIIPVVFIVNDVLRDATPGELNLLANKIKGFVTCKVLQSGKSDYNELQIDCDWTTQTRENYFYLLRQIKPLLAGKKLSVTLRLHQVKNQKKAGSLRQTAFY